MSMDIDVFIPKFPISCVSCIINGIFHDDLSQENIVEQSHYAHKVFDVSEQFSQGWECNSQAEISAKSPCDGQDIINCPSGPLLTLCQQEVDIRKGSKCPDWVKFKLGSPQQHLICQQKPVSSPVQRRTFSWGS